MIGSYNSWFVGFWFVRVLCLCEKTVFISTQSDFNSIIMFPGTVPNKCHSWRIDFKSNRTNSDVASFFARQGVSTFLVIGINILIHLLKYPSLITDSARQYTVTKSGLGDCQAHVTGSILGSKSDFSCLMFTFPSITRDFSKFTRYTDSWKRFSHPLCE